MGRCFMKKRYLIIISFLILGSFWRLKFKIDNSAKDIIGVYIEGEYSTSVPLKDSDYYVEKIECDNGSSGEWDYVNWGLLTTNMSKKSKCNVYFKKDTIVEAIKDELDTTGKCPSINADGSVNVTSAESENSLLCSAPDNYGTSYYYRGNVSNNYVYFANFYWRIVRINGDGSIRLIYDGTKAHANGEASGDRIVGTSAFNEKIDDNAYVGYMYGTPGSSTYEETHANINDSTIKKYVDNWYENNLKGTNFEQYLADNLFCNDRRVSDYDSDGRFQLGYGKNYTVYAGAYGPWSAPQGTNNALIDLYCHQINDSFTVSDKIYGNGNLKYAIALLTKRETILAGSYSQDNVKFYLYNNYYLWTLTPDGYSSDHSIIRLQEKNGRTASTAISNDVEVGVKPVINLKQGSLKLGDGTTNNPYRIN